MRVILLQDNGNSQQDRTAPWQDLHYKMITNDDLLDRSWLQFSFYHTTNRSYLINKISSLIKAADSIFRL